MTDGLLRQRRNLIAISVVLILFDVAKVTVGQVSVLGTNLLMGNPKVVYHFLWVLWTYFLVRYLQYLHDEPDLGLRRKYTDKMDWILNRHLHETLEALHPKNRFANANHDNLKRKGFLAWELPLEVYDPSQGKASTVGKYRVPTKTMLAAIVGSIVYVIFVTPRVTDSVLPILLALLAPIVTLAMPA